MHKKLRSLVKELRSRGWDFARRNNGHGVFVHPVHGKVWCSISPRNPDHAVLNIRRDIESAEKQKTV